MIKIEQDLKEEEVVCLPSYEEQIRITKEKLERLSNNDDHPGLFTVTRLFRSGDPQQFNITRHEEKYCLDIFPYLYNDQENNPWRWKCSTLKDNNGKDHSEDRKYVKLRLTWLFNRVYRNNCLDESPRKPVPYKPAGKKIENVMNILSTIASEYETVPIFSHETNSLEDSKESFPINVMDGVVEDMAALKIGHEHISRRLSNVEQALNLTQVEDETNQRKRTKADQTVNYTDEMSASVHTGMSDFTAGVVKILCEESTNGSSTDSCANKKRLKSKFPEATIRYTTVTVESEMTCTVQVDFTQEFRVPSVPCVSESLAKANAYSLLRRELEYFYYDYSESVAPASPCSMSVCTSSEAGSVSDAEQSVLDILRNEFCPCSWNSTPPEVVAKYTRGHLTSSKEEFHDGCKLVARAIDKKAEAANKIFRFAGTPLKVLSGAANKTGIALAKKGHVCHLTVSATKTLLTKEGPTEDAAALSALQMLYALPDSGGGGDYHHDDDMSALTESDIHKMEFDPLGGMPV
jgi:hypothetical protein